MLLDRRSRIENVKKRVYPSLSLWQRKLSLLLPLVQCFPKRPVRGPLVVRQNLLIVPWEKTWVPKRALIWFLVWFCYFNVVLYSPEHKFVGPPEKNHGFVDRKMKKFENHCSSRSITLAQTTEDTGCFATTDDTGRLRKKMKMSRAEKSSFDLVVFRDT